MKNNDWNRLLDEISKGVEIIREELTSEQDKLAAEMEYRDKVNIVAWTIRKIVEHAREGGSFRYLIYDRMGFEPDAYAVLYDAGGMEISNHFDLMDHE